MQPKEQLAGVYTAAVTPLTADLAPDEDGLLNLLDFLAKRGNHGALMLGSTGEGPSFSPAEREVVYRAAAKIKETYPNFRMLAGTGTPSLEETLQLNKIAFDLGYDGVLVLPPYYFRNATDDGLFTWFSKVIKHSIPANGFLLGYHIPQVSGVALSANLLMRIRDAFPDQFGGVKDSSGDLANTQNLAALLPEHAILVGADKLMLSGLKAQASGCITALANLAAPILRQLYNGYTQGDSVEDRQDTINAARSLLDQYRPFPGSVKGLLAEMYGFPRWPVKPPLVPFPRVEMQTAAEQLQAILANDEQQNGQP